LVVAVELVLAEVVNDQQVEVAVAIVVLPGGCEAEAGVFLVQSGGLRRILELP
jgi:hypothetical protein